MASIWVKSDNLDEANGRFEQTRLEVPIFLNSVPKSGSHLLRNVMRMFVPVEQQYKADFIQWANMQQHLKAFDPANPMLSWGHLFLADASAIETAPARRILLYRDPYDWVLARARFFVSDQFSGNLDHIKDGKLSADELITMMIFGLPGKAPSLRDIYEMNAAAWLGARCYPIRFEDLRDAVGDLASKRAERFFESLFGACGLTLPEDWRERVAIGSAPENSGTARENLTGIGLDLPDELSARHKALVDYHVPGLRRLLGYGEA
ncbi:hypothetical protein [Croceicoccus gelatinilyticus]|uniref:hypothetical protein n=1 Tax=Croceicoccus gelatinilyticus TaxID=2835536 RepID=UPI001BCFA0D6|nr:hypothetical protein [Croceicoccus gelatinilyticus]MBS7669208.1 hypothetical protein [Croceicoccus gelatinilyticus]